MSSTRSSSSIVVRRAHGESAEKLASSDDGVDELSDGRRVICLSGTELGIAHEHAEHS